MGKRAVSPEGKSVRMGRIGDLVLVENQKPHPRASKSYHAIRVQTQSGHEAALLLTQKEVDRALERARKNPEDVPRAFNLIDRLRDALD